MAADTTASLGIEVKISGAQQASNDLDRLNKSQKDAAQSTKDLNSAQQQSVSGSNAAANAQKALGASTSATAQSMSLFQRILSGIGSLFGVHVSGARAATNAVNGLSSAHGRASAATADFRNALHLLGPVAFSAGSNIQGLREISVLARTGLIGLAAGITAVLIVALEKAGDEAKKAHERLQTLLGNGAGTQAFNQLKKSADESNSSVGDLSASVETLARAEQRAQQAAGFRFPPGGATQSFTQLSETPGAVVTGGSGAAGVIKTMSQALQLDRASATDAAKAVSSYIDVLTKLDAQTGKSAGLTLDLFTQIEKDSPTLANALARALTPGGKTTDLEQVLQNGSISLEKFEDAVRRSADNIQSAYGKMVPNVSQGVDQLKKSLVGLFDTLGETANITGATGALTKLTASVKDINEQVKNGTFWKSFFNTLFEGVNDFDALGNSTKSWNDILKLTNDQTSIWGHSLTVDIGGAINKLITEMDQLQNAAQSAFDGLIQSAVNAAKSVAQSVASIVQSVASGIAQMAKGSASSSLNPALTSVGMPSFDASGSSQFIDQSGGSLAATDLPDNLFNFATGGLAVVDGPNSGKDKTLVQFMATKGEVVAIGVPGQPTSAIGGATAQLAPRQQTISASSSLPSVASPPTQVPFMGPNGLAPAGSLAAPLGSGPIDAFGNTVGPNQMEYVSLVQTSTGTNPAVSGSTSVVYTLNPNYKGGSTFAGSFANGGEFITPGSGGVDSQLISMRATPGEPIRVGDISDKPEKKKLGESKRPITFNFYNSDAQSFMSGMTQSQVRRAMRMAMR